MSTTKQRKSNLELLRIASMILIIMNHYCSYLSFDETAYGLNRVVNVVFGSWGGLGVDIFIIISVWFLCEDNAKFNLEKIFHLVLETIFYTLLWVLLGVKLGIVSVTVKTIAKSFLSPFLGTYWFVTAYICFYLIMPFLNKAVNSLNTQNLRTVVLVFTIVVQGFQMVILGNPNYGIVSTFCYLYLLMAYLKRTPNNFLERHCCSIAIITFIVICCGVFVGRKYNLNGIVSFCCAKYSLLLILLAVSIFYIFMKTPHFTVGWINGIAASTFGVYLFHSGPISQSFLAVNVAQDVHMYQQPYFIISVIGYGIIIFVVGMLIDLLRRVTLEKCVIWLLQKCTRGQQFLKRCNDEWSMRQ